MIEGDAQAAQANPLAPKPPQFSPKVKRVIYLHMSARRRIWTCSTTSRSW